MGSFNELGVSDALIAALKKQDIDVPTSVQEQSIPTQLEGKDIIGCAETGSGKTFAYLLPLLMKIDTEKKGNQALILTPTHELAIQVRQEMDRLSQSAGLGVTSTVCVGGVAMKRQLEALKKKPHVIVGSAGRIHDLMDKRKIAVSLDTVIIDEADRMLDHQNLMWVRKVLKRVYHTRQTLLFSATISQQTLKTAQEFTNAAEYINVKQERAVNPDIEHVYIIADLRDKIKQLRKIAAAISPERALVFINRPDDIEKLSERLKHHHLKAACIHGTAKKPERKDAMQKFKTGKVQLLVSSDLSARGLDIRGVRYIIHYDMPEDKSLYLHRSGRTGRAGDEGISIALVTEVEQKLLARHAAAYGIDITETVMSRGELVDKV